MDFLILQSERRFTLQDAINQHIKKNELKFINFGFNYFMKTL